MRRDLRDISGGVKRRSIGPEARAGGPERPAPPCGARTRLESDCRSPSSSAVGGRPGMTAARRYIAAAPREIKNLAIRPWPPSRGTRVAGLQIIFFARGRGGRPGGVSTGLGGAWVVPRGAGGGWREKKLRISFRRSVLAQNPSLVARSLAGDGSAGPLKRPRNPYSASCGFLGRKQPQSCRNPVWGPHRERRLGVPRRRGVALLLSGGHGDHPRKAATTVTGEHRARAKTRGPARRLRAPRCRGSVRYHSPAQRTRPVE